MPAALRPFVAGLLMLLLIAPSHAAEAPAAPGQTPAEKAEALKRSADAAFLEKDFARALSRLEQAYAIDPQPRYIANQGLVLEQLGQFKTAVEKLQQFLASNPAPEPAKAAAARQVIERLQPRVRITSTPAGAAVRIDGSEPVGVTPYDTRLVAGLHTLTLELAGHAPVRTTAKVVVREGLSFHATLVALPEPEPPVVRDRGLGTDGWGYITLGGAALAGAGAATFYVLAADAADTRDAATTGASWDEAQTRLENYNQISLIAAVAAGAALTAGIVLIAIEDGPEVTASPAPGGAVIEGRF